MFNVLVNDDVEKLDTGSDIITYVVKYQFKTTIP